ncbi:MAG: hypothetical protein NC253_00885 [Ruminococcus sp.]|nr:hypothetical protein [Ruminococcus sp.]MCM1382643.1 hypothetical protein [Muribaculaceae bacterium]MCM1478974.1 hypothetical protein [Muribaculaceae bacterium]
MGNYCEIQAKKIEKWVKLFLMMSSSQKIVMFTEDEPFYEGTVSEVTFEDLAVFAEYEPTEISAKDGIIVISVESPDN